MAKKFVITQRGATLLREITSKVVIRPSEEDTDNNRITFTGLWDSGASASCINESVVKKLNLRRIGEMTVSTANGKAVSKQYIVDVDLPNGITVQHLTVGAADLGDLDMLIGMDIITFGDFAISNACFQTTFSFRMPPGNIIDFEQI